MYYWYTLDTDDLENPSCLTISEIEWRMHCAPMHCFQSDFRQEFSSKPETDESHLVRDQDCDTGAPNQQLQYGLALPSTSVDSHYHRTTKRQI
ncbi:hypothetical protein TNCV_1818831 [Trichonephila clavipes]|nr:hypothetical protein TNCV_1818831 [Trichonephila clavipes]